MRILQVTPTFFSDDSVIGGGERYVHNVCSAVAQAARGEPVRCDMLSFSPCRDIVPIGPITDLHLIPGAPGDMLQCAGDALDDLLDVYDVVHVHQCLLPWGIFVAARARIAGKTVLGTDHGGGETALLTAFPRLGNLYDALHAQSNFAASAFLQLSGPVRVILGPVDETLVPLNRGKRERGRIVALGRILPHKGFEHAIEALPEGASLTIMGRPLDGVYLDFLRRRALGKDVRFETGFDDQAVVGLLGSAGLCVHTGTHFRYDGGFVAKPELLALGPIEAMCAGTPAIVSRAGALPELSALPACRAYTDIKELAELLRAHMADELFSMAPEEIREAAITRYGLAQFGAAYMRLIVETRAKATA
jgi:glycosyltransferase involved in cell wall biosynthesis